MRHRVAGKQLSVDKDHRKAMLRNLAAALFEHGQIETTLQKAKAVQPMVEKIITKAKKGTLASRRHITSVINDRNIFVWVADPNVKDWKKDNPFFELPDASEVEFNRYGETRKAPRLVQHIMKTIAPMFADRDGGYTRIVKMGRHRQGDGSGVVVLQLVGKEEGPELGGNVSRRRAQADKRTAFAAKLRKGAAAKPEAEADAGSA
jgi:large subunit ribosomal protein L17